MEKILQRSFKQDTHKVVVQEVDVEVDIMTDNDSSIKVAEQFRRDRFEAWGVLQYIVCNAGQGCDKRIDKMLLTIIVAEWSRLDVRVERVSLFAIYNLQARHFLCTL